MKESKTNIYAILSLIFAFVFFPLGLAFGIVALYKIKRTHEHGKGLAVAGLVLSSLALFGFIIIYSAILFAVGTVVEETEKIATTFPLEKKSSEIPKPFGNFKQNTKDGITLIVDDYTFSQSSSEYGKLKDLNVILQNEQGSESIFPTLLIIVEDLKEDSFTVEKTVSLSEYVRTGESIRINIITDLGVGALSNPKEIKISVIEWNNHLVSVDFPVDFKNNPTLG